MLRTVTRWSFIAPLPHCYSLPQGFAFPYVIACHRVCFFMVFSLKLLARAIVLLQGCLQGASFLWVLFYVGL